MIALPQVSPISSDDSSHTPTVGELFADRINECNTDLELSRTIEAIEGALMVGALSTTIVEGLASSAVARGRIIHQASRVVTFRVAAEELIARDQHCPCCKHRESWGGGGTSTCNVCHPRATMRVTRAAA